MFFQVWALPVFPQFLIYLIIFTDLCCCVLQSAVDNGLNPEKYLKWVLEKLSAEGLKDSVLDEVISRPCQLSIRTAISIHSCRPVQIVMTCAGLFCLCRCTESLPEPEMLDSMSRPFTWQTKQDFILSREQERFQLQPQSVCIVERFTTVIGPNS